MPTKKKRFNARFPPARIKKIMQTDEEVGKVAAAVPVIISKALEMFMQSLVENACDYAQSRNAKTMTTGHLYRSKKKCILAQQQFDFLKDLVEHVPDLPTNEDDTEGEVKPKRRRTQPQDHEKKKRERKKPKPSVSDESEEELQSDEEEEDSGSSEGLGTNPSSSTTNLPKSSVARSTSQLSEQADSRSDHVAASYVPQFSQFSSMLSAAQDEEDDDYDA